MEEDKLKMSLMASLEKYAEKIAFYSEDIQITYDDLEQYIRTLSNILVEHKTTRTILCFFNNNMECAIALAATIHAEKIFCPVDIKKEDDWFVSVLSDYKSNTVLTDQENIERIKKLNNTYDLDLNILCFDVKRKKIEYLESKVSTKGIVFSEFENRDLQYIYNTSGSSGSKKAVMGRRSALYRFLQWEITTFEMDFNDRFMQLTNPNFDPYLRDILVPLLMGAMICFPDERGGFRIERIVKEMIQYKITVLHTIPSMIRKFLKCVEFKFTDLRYILSAGEMLFGEDIREFYLNSNGKTYLVNLYGPTETTLAKFYYIVTPEDQNKERIPVGFPIGRTKVYLIDQKGELLEKGMEGEVVIQTYDASLGYLNASNHSFLMEKNGYIHYRTKDRGFLRPDGALELSGRLNGVIKINGRKVDLELFSLQLKQHPSLEDGCVLNFDTDSGQTLLAAVIVLKKGWEVGTVNKDMNEFLLQHGYGDILPAIYPIYKELPRNTNGKIDRVRLKQEVEFLIHSNDNPPQEEVEPLLILKNIINQVLGGNLIKQISPEDTFIKLGIDSLSMMEILFQIEDAFKVTIDESRLDLSDLSIRDILDIITKQKTNGENKIK